MFLLLFILGVEIDNYHEDDSTNDDEDKINTSYYILSNTESTDKQHIKVFKGNFSRF